MKEGRALDSSSPRPLDHLARLLFQSGRIAEAVETEEKAIRLLPPSNPESSDSSMREELEKNLARFQAALEEVPPSSGTSNPDSSK